MSIVETIRIKDGKGGFIIINKDQYDKDKHEEYHEVVEEKKEVKKPKKEGK